MKTWLHVFLNDSLVLANYLAMASGDFGCVARRLTAGLLHSAPHHQPEGPRSNSIGLAAARRKGGLLVRFDLNSFFDNCLKKIRI